MGILRKVGEFFESGDQPPHCTFEGVESGGLTADVFREAPIDTSDPEAVAKRDQLRELLFAVAFGTTEERASHGLKCFPFDELPPDAVMAMPPELAASYHRELAHARDPRSGRIVRSNLLPTVVEDPQM